MDYSRVTRAADKLVSAAKTEEALVALIAEYQGRRGFNDDLTMSYVIAREVVKRAYRKLATFG